MRRRTQIGLLVLCLALGAIAWVAFSKKPKSTPELLADLKSAHEKERVIAVRLLPQRKADAVLTVPALIDALKDQENDIRRGAAIGLGYLGASAQDAVPALQAALSDRDARVREAAGVALSRIEPARFAAPAKSARKAK